jgi:hypothetical protein
VDPNKARLKREVRRSKRRANKIPIQSHEDSLVARTKDFLAEVFGVSRVGNTAHFGRQIDPRSALEIFIDQIPGQLLYDLNGGEHGYDSAGSAQLYVALTLRQIDMGERDEGGVISVAAKEKDIAKWVTKLRYLMSLERLRRKGWIEVQDFPGPTENLWNDVGYLIRKTGKAEADGECPIQ